MAAVAAAVAWWLRAILFPFVLALAISYVLQPVVSWIESRGVERTSAIAGTYLAIASLLLGFSRFALPAAVDEAAKLAGALPDLISDVERWLRAVQLGVTGTLGPEVAGGPMSELLQSVRESVQRRLEAAVESVPGLLTGTAAVVLSPFLAYYMLKDAGRLGRHLLGLVPTKYRTVVGEAAAEIDRVLAAYVRGQIIVALIVGSLATIGLLVLNVRFALVLGMIAGLFEVVPYFGPFLGATPAVLVALVDSPVRALKVAVLFVIIQQVDAALVSPRVIGSRVGLHPLTVVFLLLLGGRLLGLVGVLIAVPVSLVVRILVVYAWRQIVDAG